MKTFNIAARNYLAVTVVYLLMAIILPANRAAMQNYHLTSIQYHVIFLSLVVPLVAIWLIGFYGAAKISQYARMVRKSGEGEGMEQLSAGVNWMAWLLPVSAIVTLVAGAIANTHTGFQGASVIITDYVQLFITITAFTMFGRGARSLSSFIKARLELEQGRVVIFMFLLLGVAYCFFTFRSLNLHSLTSTNNPYYLPVWLLITTVIIPYLYAWFAGLLASFELLLYARKVQGVLYRQAMRLLALGCVSVIGGSVSSQYLLSAVPRSAHLSFNATLIIVNIIYVFMAAGFILITIGAHRLKMIEEI